MKLGVITTGALGWRSIGKRWREHLPSRVDGETFFLEIQDFHGPESRLPILSRHAWLRAACRGRRSAKEAIRQGADTILLCTIADAGLLPRKKGVRYLIYGDATPRQLAELYYNDRADNWRKRYFRKRISRLADDGHVFLCMSEWYRQGAIADYGAKNTVLLPPFLDTDLWRPSHDRPEPLPLRALFIGADFDRKGGDIVLDLAKWFAASEIEWHVVTKEVGPSSMGLHFHTGLGPDDSKLIELAQSCHLFVFPTRADCSPLAVLEAGAAGLPVIATKVGGIADMVETGVNGTLVEKPAVDAFANALERYLSDSCRYVREGERARKGVIERNSVEAHMDALLKAINRAA